MQQSFLGFPVLYPSVLVLTVRVAKLLRIAKNNSGAKWWEKIKPKEVK